MIVDTHVHYVEPPSAERPHDPSGAPAKHLLVEDLLAQAAEIGIDKIVQVTPTAMGWDNRYGLEGAQRYPGRVLGVFGRFDPLAPDLEGRLVAFMTQPGMLGVRIQPRPGEASERWLRDRVIDPFFTLAEKHDVAIGCYAPNQPRELHDAARRFPKLRMIVEHMALINHGGGKDAFAQWPAVLALAAEPNVWMKVSYFPEAASSDEPFPYVRSQERFKELYEKVGASRLVWGSNYPPVSKVCTYRESLDFIRNECAFLSGKDRAAILGGNFVAAFCPAVE